MKAIFRIMTITAMACSVQLSFAQETKIRFFGQPEINSTKVTEKSSFLGVDETGHYVKKDTSYSKTNFNSGNYVLFVTSQLSERVFCTERSKLQQQRQHLQF